MYSRTHLHLPLILNQHHQGLLKNVMRGDFDPVSIRRLLYHAEVPSMMAKMYLYPCSYHDGTRLYECVKCIVCGVFGLANACYACVECAEWGELIALLMARDWQRVWHIRYPPCKTPLSRSFLSPLCS